MISGHRLKLLRTTTSCGAERLLPASLCTRISKIKAPCNQDGSKKNKNAAWSVFM